MKRKRLRIGVCTGGGDCPGLNAAVRAIVRHAIGTYGMDVVGLRDGLSGVMQHPPDTVPLNMAAVSPVHALGGTILGTSNKGSPFQGAAESQRILAAARASWRDLGLDALVVVGGDGTHLMAKRLVTAGLAIVGVPKTIDNDLYGTDETIGFATAVEIGAEAALRLRSSAEAHNRIMILEVMGRDAGHIALSVGVASAAHAALLPEVPFSYDVLAKRFADRRALGRDSFLIIAAEGAHPLGGERSFKASKANATSAKLLGGIGQQVADELFRRSGVDARVAVLGHVQRGGPPNAADRILAARLGAHAVDLVASGKVGRIAGIAHGEVTDFSYRRLVEGRRPVALGGTLVATAEAIGISLGRPSGYKAAE